MRDKALRQTGLSVWANGTLIVKQIRCRNYRLGGLFATLLARPAQLGSDNRTEVVFYRSTVASAFRPAVFSCDITWRDQQVV